MTALLEESEPRIQTRKQKHKSERIQIVNEHLDLLPYGSMAVLCLDNGTVFREEPGAVATGFLGFRRPQLICKRRLRRFIAVGAELVRKERTVGAIHPVPIAVRRTEY